MMPSGNYPQLEALSSMRQSSSLPRGASFGRPMPLPVRGGPSPLPPPSGPYPIGPLPVTGGMGDGGPRPVSDPRMSGPVPLPAPNPIPGIPPGGDYRGYPLPTPGQGRGIAPVNPQPQPNPVAWNGQPGVDQAAQPGAQPGNPSGGQPGLDPQMLARIRQMLMGGGAGMNF